jgi:hypothetical protein
MSNFVTPHLIDESAIDRSFKSMAEIALKNSDHELNGSLMALMKTALPEILGVGSAEEEVEIARVEAADADAHREVKTLQDTATSFIIES